MKRKGIILSVFTFIVCLTAGAQNEMSTAILQSGDNVTMFTGSNALINAHSAAKDGDVITLSAGKFNGPTIEKSVSIYGAGYEKDDETGTDITEISGITIGKQDATIDYVHLEGVYVNGMSYIGGNGYFKNTLIKSLQVVRVKFNDDVRFYCDMTNALFDQCVFDYIRAYPDANDIQATIQFKNSFLGNELWYFNTGCIVNIDHCILTKAIRLSSCTISNSIAFVEPSCSPVFYNMVATFGNSYGCEKWYQVSSNQIFSDVESGFTTYTPQRTFEIQQPNVWTGTDGTEIGIRGGDGWIKAPTTPVLKNLKTRVDGMTLQVEYQTAPRN